eukprot:2490226-Amphidinium_carterae.2
MSFKICSRQRGTSGQVDDGGTQQRPWMPKVSMERPLEKPTGCTAEMLPNCARRLKRRLHGEPVHEV